MTEERDNAGVVAPPPLIYLGSLVLGLLLKRQLRTDLLPRTMARALGWPLVVDHEQVTVVRAKGKVHAAHTPPFRHPDVRLPGE